MKIKYRKRNVTLKVYCTENDAAALRTKAATANRSVSGFVLLAALGKKIESIPAVNASLYADLARVGSNLNQITRTLRHDWEIGRLPERDYSQLLAAIGTTHKALDETRRSLIGCGP